MQEELGLTVPAPTYLCSQWDKYLFLDVMYLAAIAFYVVRVNDISKAKANDDIDAFFLVKPNDIDDDKLAFKSHRVALNRYNNELNVEGKH